MLKRVIKLCAGRLLAFARSALAEYDGRNAVPAADQGRLVQSCWEEYKDYIRIHPSVIIGPSASLRIPNPPVPAKVMLEIGEGSHIFSSFVLLRPEARITVGRNCQLGFSSFIAAKSITVEDDVIMAWENTIIDTDNHALDWNERRHDVMRCREAYRQTKGADIGRLHDWSPVHMEPIVLGRKSWFGFRCIILKGVHVGEGSVIGAGSVVTRAVPDWSVAAGNPCVVLRQGVPSMAEASL